ncbi:hypothetical protein JHK86_024600 [Glycine max]|nr:hypothetical protein JHK86_024600 [Glycine max]
MTDPNNLQQLQNHIAEMERRQKEELTRLKADHDQLEACVRRSQSDEQSTHTLLERTQGESHPRRINNSANNLSPSYMHCPVARTVCQHLFIDRIMEADILLGNPPSTLEVQSTPSLTAFPMEDNLASPKNGTYTLFGTSALTLLTLPWSEVSLLSLLLKRDFKGINPVNQDDPVVVSIIIVNFIMSRVLID